MLCDMIIPLLIYVCTHAYIYVYGCICMYNTLLPDRARMISLFTYGLLLFLGGGLSKLNIWSITSFASLIMFCGTLQFEIIF
jgi:hypothetical protein